MSKARLIVTAVVLAQKTTDEDLFELVSQKAKAFNAFADESSLTDESGMAVASTEAGLEAVLRERIRARQLAS